MFLHQSYKKQLSCVYHSQSLYILLHLRVMNQHIHYIKTNNLNAIKIIAGEL